MSLSRILNDDPVPAVSSTRDYPVPSATIPLDTSQLLVKSPRPNGHFSPPNIHHDHLNEFRPSGYSDPTPGGQSFCSCLFRSIAISLSGTPQYQAEHASVGRPLSPDRISEPISYVPLEDDALPRKRRRGGNPELDERHTLTTRRVS